MAAKSHGSVRMGPISIFTLVIILCLAVMAVLSFSTAKATYASSQRHASSTTELYALEEAAQGFTANVDGILGDVRASGGTQQEAVKALEAASEDALLSGVRSEDITVSLQVGKAPAKKQTEEEVIEVEDGTATTAIATAEDAAAASSFDADVTATFTATSGRYLTVQLSVTEDASYQILQWKTAKIWDATTGNDVLWSGTSTEDEEN